jgi:glycosyltransferase involved in cell wall biosynthesis
MTVLLCLAFLFALLALLLGVTNLARYRPPPEWRERSEQVAGPLISVCVPARNEAANLEPCVRSILAQRGVLLEVLVYDDQSEDETPRILHRLTAEDSRVRRVPTAALPEGWNGKQWGCDRMGRAAQGEWLLFTDADVRFEPECLARTLAEAQRGGAACVSTIPRQETGSLAEALLVPLIHFVLLSYLPMGRMRATLDPATSAGCGQFLFVRRDAWRAVGGHGAFRGSMHDGIKLPRAMRRGGFRTDLFDGTEIVHCRMYHGVGAAWRGFSKNAYEGLGSPAILLLFAALHLVGHVWPWLFLAWAAFNGATPWQWGLAGAAIAAALLERTLLARRFRQPWLSVILHPLGVALMTVIQWWSAWLHISGRRAWRGRVATEAG